VLPDAARAAFLAALFLVLLIVFDRRERPLPAAAGPIYFAAAVAVAAVAARSVTLQDIAEQLLLLRLLEQGEVRADADLRAALAQQLSAVRVKGLGRHADATAA
jgi:hypothetical protein